MKMNVSELRKKLDELDRKMVALERIGGEGGMEYRALEREYDRVDRELERMESTR